MLGGFGSRRPPPPRLPNHSQNPQYRGPPVPFYPTGILANLRGSQDSPYLHNFLQIVLGVAIPGLLFMLFAFARPYIFGDVYTPRVEEEYAEALKQRNLAMQWTKQTRQTLKSYERLEYEDLLQDLRRQNPRMSKYPQFMQDKMGEAIMRQCALSVWQLADMKQLSRPGALKAEAVCTEAKTLIKTVDMSNAVEGWPMDEVQAQQLKKVFLKVTHDAHNIGFQSDAIKAPSIPPIPKMPSYPGTVDPLDPLFKDLFQAPEAPYAPGVLPSPFPPPMLSPPPGPPKIFVPSPPLPHPPPPYPGNHRIKMALRNCQRGNYREKKGKKRKRPCSMPLLMMMLPPGQFITDKQGLDEAASRLASVLVSNYSKFSKPPAPQAPMPPQVPHAPPRSPPPHYPNVPALTYIPLPPAQPAPPLFTMNCKVNKETAIKNTVRLKYCEFNTLPAMVGQFTQMPAIGFQGRKMLQALPMHNGETSDPYAVPGLTRPRVTLPESVAASFLKDHAANHRAASAVMGIRTGDHSQLGLQVIDGHKCRLFYIGARDIRLPVFLEATARTLRYYCDVRVYDEDLKTLAKVKARVEEHEAFNTNTKTKILTLQAIVGTNLGASDEEKAAGDFRTRTTMDTLLCEPILAGSTEADRTASNVPYCQIGDVPLIVISASVNPWPVLRGMTGALKTRYPGAVVWEVNPYYGVDLMAHVHHMQEHGYSVFAVYKDDQNDSEISPNLLLMDKEDLLLKLMANAMFQHDIVPVFIAVRQDHPYHKTAMQTVTCNLDDMCETGMCSVPVDCGCAEDGSPMCRDERSFASAVKPQNHHADKRTTHHVIALHPHTYEPNEHLAEGLIRGH